MAFSQHIDEFLLDKVHLWLESLGSQAGQARSRKNLSVQNKQKVPARQS